MQIARNSIVLRTGLGLYGKASPGAMALNESGVGTIELAIFDL